MGISNNRSFLAKIKFNGEDVIFYDKHSYGMNFSSQKNSITTPQGPAKTGDVLASFTPDIWDSPEFAYFIGHDDYSYKIQFRSGNHHAKYLGTASDSTRALRVYPDAVSATSFTLYDSNLNIITLDDITSTNKSVYLQQLQGPFIKRQLIDDQMYSYSGRRGNLVKLDIEIVERGFDGIENYGFSRSAGHFLRLDSN